MVLLQLLVTNSLRGVACKIFECVVLQVFKSRGVHIVQMHEILLQCAIENMPLLWSSFKVY